MTTGRTLLDRIWEAHVVDAGDTGRPAILYVDLHLLNEVTSPQAFAVIAERGLPVRRPDLSLATIDHSTPTRSPDAQGTRPYVSPAAERQVATMRQNAERYGIRFLGWDSPDRGIIHVAAPELGITRPGMTIVCGDSHTSTHGAFGALAFGIGTSEIAHVLATQCLLQTKPQNMRITIDGTLGPGVTAKDVALTVMARVGASGATGHVIEYAGSTVRSFSMEERMTLCNMSIECGARAGMIAPDETTIAWLRRHSPRAASDAAIEGWLSFSSDPAARFDREIAIDAAPIAPMVTWGISPDTAISVTGSVPPVDSSGAGEARRYMGTEIGQTMIGMRVDLVFIGSCTNARLPDLRAAAAVLRGRRVATGVSLLVVPGSERVRRESEAEGLDRVFIDAGGEWRLSGCSMCLGMNGDLGAPGKLVLSTSNRNFPGRQGPGARTILASPVTAAASAVTGVITDPRTLIDG